MERIPIITSISPKELDQIETDIKKAIKLVLGDSQLKANSLSTGWKVLAIIFLFTGILTIAGLVMLAISAVNAGKIKQQFPPSKILEYYQDIANNQLPITVNNLNTGFTMPLTSEAANYYPSTVLSGTVKQKFPFEIGNKYEIIVHYNPQTKREEKTYRWYRYLTCRINPTNFTTTLTPENAFTRFFHKRSQIELESITFEKLFKVDYDQPIKLRKFFTPKIMAQILDAAEVSDKYNLDTPDIYLNNDLIIFKWYRGTTSTPVNGKETIAADLIGFNSKPKALAAHITQKIIDDFIQVSLGLKWVAAFDRWTF